MPVLQQQQDNESVFTEQNILLQNFLNEPLLSQHDISSSHHNSLQSLNGENIHSSKKLLEIMFFNVEGLKSKLGNEINDLVKKCDVVGFVETWLAPGDEVDVQNFSLLGSKSNLRKATKGRYPGGISVYCRKKLIDVFKKPTLSSKIPSGALWFLVKSQTQTFALAMVYNPPRGSDFFEDSFFDDLSSNMAEIEIKYNCNNFLIGGDMNARIKDWQNLVAVSNKEEWDVGDGQIQMPMRKSKDKEINTTGGELKRFCQSHDLVILNGANKEMDHFFTYVSPQGGGSVIDLVLVSNQFYKNVTSLKISDTSISFHLPVKVNLEIELETEQTKSQRNQKTKYIDQYRWKKHNDSLSYVRQKMIQVGDLIVPAISFFAITGSISKALNLITVLFTVVCDRLKISNKKRPVKRDNKSPWFNSLCQEWKKKTTSALRLFRKFGGENKLTEYLKSRKEYFFVRKKAKSDYWEEKVKTISMACKAKDAVTIWSEIKKHTGKIKKSESTKISSQAWLKHFNNVLNKEPADCPQWNLDGRERQRDDELEQPITRSEIRWSLEKIKHGKSAGPDSIIGDFLKYFPNILVPCLHILFNKIWNTCEFPVSWAQSIIVPLHKKGSTCDPNNYRGIALLSHLGKIFTRILNKRLVSWIEKNFLLSECQAGFRRGYSTLDNIFILDTLIQERLQKKGCALYCCFVDLKKCFDWVDRGALFFKLWNLGMPEKLLNILQDYYQKSQFSVRLDKNQTTEFSKSVSGVFQGCQMSPQLFTLFINDLVERLGGDDVHAPEIDGVSVHTLLYADDLVLISHSPIGLQRMLDKLGVYCNQWKVQLSLEKTKIVVFKKGRKLSRAEKWFYLGNRVEVVPEYKYLGVIFKYNGDWTHHIENAKMRADRACTALLKFVLKYRLLPVSFTLQLFDSVVASVLSYGSEIWGGSFFSEKTSKNLESVALRFYKSLLGIPKGSPSTGVLLELDRIKFREQIFINSVRFWLRISFLPQTRLVYKCLQKQIRMADQGRKCWALQVKNGLNCLGLSVFWTRGVNLGKKKVMSIVKQRVKDISRATLIEEAKEKIIFNILC